MKPETQRIAIAEECGFVITLIEYDADGCISRVWATTPDSWSGKDVRPWLPDFTGDLNAMHEAEKVLTPKQQTEYAYQLEALCCPREYGWHATAAQRAEAFLKTLNLWTE